MRLHRNLVFTVIDSLMAIFNEGAYADKMVAQALKKDKRWGSSDRKFVAETIYEIVRWKRLYTEIAEVKDPFTRDDIWRIFAVWAVLRGIKLPDWKYFEGTPTRKIKGRFDELTKIRKFKEAIPDWIDELGLKELGKEYEIIDKKRATYYGIGLGLTKIIKAILNDQNEIMTVSTYLKGEYGHEGLYIGVPTIINRKGAREVLELPLEGDEKAKFDKSCETLMSMKGEIDKVIKG